MRVVMHWLDANGELAAYRQVDIERPVTGAPLLNAIPRIASAHVVYVDGVMVKHNRQPVTADTGGRP